MIYIMYIYIYKTKTETKTKTKTKAETKTKTREGGVRREWGEGMRGGGGGHASILWNITIQKHHTVLPYRITIQ
jgi:hypothetical protein